MTARSNRADVRNPVLGCPKAMAAFADCPPEAREALAKALRALSDDWRATANELWRKHKPPMASYWKINAVNARHLALAIRSIPAQPDLFNPEGEDL